MVKMQNLVSMSEIFNKKFIFVNKILKFFKKNVLDKKLKAL